MKFRGIPQHGMMHSTVRGYNKVKCVFWGEKESIFALELLCIKGGNTQDVHQTRHCRNGAIFKRDSLHQIPYLVVASRISKVKVTCHIMELG
jgi:hypothetical protein